MSSLDLLNKLEESVADANIQSLSAVERFHSHRLNPDDTGDGGLSDPAIVAQDVESQTTFIRKLKFQYIEQNAKDKYVKYIVNDLDDAPFIGEHDIKELDEINKQLKLELNNAKAKAAQLETVTKELAPKFAKRYDDVRRKLGRGRYLAQQILDARLALTRLQKMHPHPRLTITTANKKLEDQVTEMQELSDKKEVTAKELVSVKDKVKRADLEVEALMSEKMELEKEMKKRDVAEDDRRLVPLYDWYTRVTSLFKTAVTLTSYEVPSDNELRLTYRRASGKSVVVSLVFMAGTQQLAEIRVVGEDGSETDAGSEIDVFCQANDVRGGIAAALSIL